MSFHLLDSRGQPRHPALWLVLAALASSQLLGLYAVCVHQVREAQERRAEVQVAPAQDACPGGCTPLPLERVPALPPGFSWR